MFCSLQFFQTSIQNALTLFYIFSSWTTRAYLHYAMQYFVYACSCLKIQKLPWKHREKKAIVMAILLESTL